MSNRYICYSGIEVFELSTVAEEDAVQALYPNHVIVKTRTAIADLVRYNIIPTPEGYVFDYDAAVFREMTDSEKIGAGLLTVDAYNAGQEQRRRQAYAVEVDGLVAEYTRLAVCGMASKQESLIPEIKAKSLDIHNRFLYWEEEAWQELPVDAVETEEPGTEAGAEEGGA